MEELDGGPAVAMLDNALSAVQHYPPHSCIDRSTLTQAQT